MSIDPKSDIRHAHWEIKQTLSLLWAELNNGETRDRNWPGIFKYDEKWIELFEYEESKHG